MQIRTKRSLSQGIIFSATLVITLILTNGIFHGSVGQHRCNILLLISSSTFISSVTGSCCGKIIAYYPLKVWYGNRPGDLMHACSLARVHEDHTLAFAKLTPLSGAWPAMNAVIHKNSQNYYIPKRGPGFLVFIYLCLSENNIIDALKSFSHAYLSVRLLLL